MKKKFIESSGNVFKDVGFNDVEARSLHARSCVINLLVGFIQKRKMTQKEAADFFKVSQPRISNLMRGRIDLFSIDTLFNMMERAGFRIYQRIEVDASHFLGTVSVLSKHQSGCFGR